MTNQEYVKIVADFDEVSKKLEDLGKCLSDGISELNVELAAARKCIEQFRADWDGFWSGINKIHDNINIKGSDLIFPLNSYDEDKRNIRKDFPI